MLEECRFDGIIIGTRCSLHTKLAVKVLKKKENFFKRAFKDMAKSAKSQHEVDKANFKAAKAEAKANFEENRGKHVAWNEAAKLAMGEIFIVVDCDDVVCQHRLAQLVGLVEGKIYVL